MNKSELPLKGDNEFELQKVKFKAARKSTLISVAVNTVLSVWQIIIGIFSHSSGLIADGIHTLSDLIADFVVLIANKKSHKKPDEDHPYGHFRYENGASLILGIILLIVGVGMVWSAIQKMLNPELIQEVHMIALVAALISLVAKEGLFRYMLRVANKVNSSMLVANAWHARSDAASSLVVAIGIIGSLCGFRIFDPIAALIVGTFVFRMGYKFTNQSIQDLMDKGADEETLMEIRQILDNSNEIAGYHDLKTRKSGDFYLVDVHLELDGNMTIFKGHEITVNVQKRLMQHPQILNVMTHLDPYDENGPH
ncbi:cation diffusion facilitator family transporter [Providencia sp.]|uniref:cation diffusion facilitator family transporter n=1 Tax=Providencia sp. TaxID=589 RepID=UPI000E872ABC|nr:cation diffusion facilitator family transporter [Providencia sp.]MBP6081613.1 cation transporter [Providencia sp.]HBO24852.1 cation-efflux pump [Providencia sp.]